MPRTIDTTLPWEDNGNGLIYGQAEGEEDDAPFIADVCDDPNDYTEHEQAKAEYLTRACNHHVQLVRALRELQTVMPADSAWQLNQPQLASLAMRIKNVWDVLAAPVLAQLQEHPA